MRGSHSMSVEVSQWLNLNTLWKRPICELLQEWRKNLASLVFFIFLLINLTTVTLGTDTDSDSHNRTVVWGGVGYAGYSGSKGAIAGAVSMADILGGDSVGRDEGGSGVGYSVGRGKRDTRRHDVSGKDKGRSSHHHSTTNQSSVDSNNNNKKNHHKHSTTKEDCDHSISTNTSLMDTQDTSSQSSPSSYKNQTVFASSQCLPHTINTTTTTQKANHTKKVLTSICNATTGKRTAEKTLPFCSMFLYSDTIESMDLVCPDRGSSRSGSMDGGQEYITRILSADRDAQTMFFHFEKVVLHHFDCRDPEVPRRWNCTDCENAYKNWLCSMTIPFYSSGQPIPPCGDYCEEVVRVCPYLLPELNSQYMGQSSFLCTVPKIPHQTQLDEMVSCECHKLSHKGGTSVCVPQNSARSSRDTNSSPNQTPSQSPPKSNDYHSQNAHSTDNQMPVSPISSSSDSVSRDGTNNVNSSKSSGVDVNRSPDSSLQQQGNALESVSDNRETNVELLDSSTSSEEDISTAASSSSSGSLSLHRYLVKHKQHLMAACLAQLFTVLFVAQYLCMADVFSVKLCTCSAYT